MEKQYIGARYVPKFAEPIDWQEDMSYEALTIVSYMGASYTSKKSVPAGIKPTNSSYWAVTGNYNAQVEAYRQEVAGITDKVNILTNRKIMFVSDSYGLSPNADKNWITFATNSLGLTMGVDAFNVSKSGAGFNVNGVNHMLQLITNANVGDRTLITDIVVACGFNDANTDNFIGSELPAQIGNFANYAKQNYPNAKLWLGCVGYGWYGNTLSPNFTNVKYLNTLWNYQYGAGVHGMAWLTNCEYTMHMTTLFADDHIHPNLSGAERIGFNIACAVNGGAVTTISVGDFMNVTAIVGDLGGGVTNKRSMGITYSTGELCFWDMPEITFTNLGDLEIGTTFVQLATAETMSWFANSPIDVPVNAICVTDFSPTSFVNVPITLRLHQGKLYVRNDYINGPTYTTNTFKSIYIKSQTISFPNMH